MGAINDNESIKITRKCGDCGNENGAQVADIMKNVAVDTNVGQNLDTWA